MSHTIIAGRISANGSFTKTAIPTARPETRINAFSLEESVLLVNLLSTIICSNREPKIIKYDPISSVYPPTKKAGQKNNMVRRLNNKNRTAPIPIKNWYLIQLQKSLPTAASNKTRQVVCNSHAAVKLLKGGGEK